MVRSMVAVQGLSRRSHTVMLREGQDQMSGMAHTKYMGRTLDTYDSVD